MRVVYNSFGGRYADNPRAVHEALLARGDGAEHVWLLDERHRAGFPDGVATVGIGTPEAEDVLRRADVVVANTHMPLDWTPTPGTTYVQTWHGTPLKRIHGDAHTKYTDEEMAALQAEVDRWSCLVGPGAAGSELLGRAFRYAGPVLDTGYPRNDVLHAPDAGERRAAVRERLGLGADEKVVLYAPTWRDDEDLAEPGIPLGLDAARLADRLGEGWRVLMRLHYFVRRTPGVEHERVLDVGDHPDIAELYLAADAFVTDYSSSLFDVAPTSLPVLLYAYDLEHYRDRLRGFYLDLDEESPGPVLRTQDALEEALLALPAVTDAWAERRAAFVQRWCPLDDGRATARLLELARL
ncbi:CDP-glycerol glycerophosphotransferase family protein [uncultured Pseudokineococcus sp.]|uniref:CDP-glycerol glycerophosphotransferase family protein n=1 Tax=uncultured Pseudokineococcus sp. TaxID=1642928 RepID=UPI002621CCC9|nr:CDP-glycerol glycerophosphotransferase family protein [uncultured Pseudokineococcus sp.]